MIARRLPALLLALALSSGCADMGAGVTDLSDQAETAAEHTRFCLSMARALTALDEGGNTSTAHEAAEEALTFAPEEMRGPATVVVDHLRRAQEGDPAALEEPALERAVEDLHDSGKAACGPTDPGA